MVSILGGGVLYADSMAPKNSTQQAAYDSDLFKSDTSVFFVNGEFLYWLVNEGDVSYAIKMDDEAWSETVPTYAIGDYHNAKYDWAPGFRLSFGHFNAPHYWDVYAQYAYVHASGSNEVHAPKESNEYLNGIWASPDMASALESAKSHIDLQYNVLDFLFTRRFHPNEHLRINVFGGLTSALIFQKWKIQYEDVFEEHSKIENRWRFEGLGLRLGLGIDWFMGYDLYLTGVASSGIVSGWYKNSAFQKTGADVAGTNHHRPILDTHFHDNRLSFTSQFAVGPSWQKGYENYRVGVFAGYEFTIWTNIQEIYISDRQLAKNSKQLFINNSNLSLQGLTVRVNVDF